MNGWQRNLNPALSSLTAYDAPPVDPSMARLNANECPEAWPPEAMEKIASAVRRIELGRYPDVSGRELRRLLAEQHGCTPEQIVLGSGSDELITMLLLTLSGSTNPLVLPTPTFVMYEHAAAIVGMRVRKAQLNAEFQLDEPTMRQALADATICFFARPNNPTGTLWDGQLIKRLIADFRDTIFVVDEAYGAYEPGCSLYDPGVPANYVHMQTFSKIGGAAIRLGYCIATPELALALNKVRHPYNISATTLAIAETMLTELQPTMDAMVQRAISRRRGLASLLSTVGHVFPSSANLVLARLRDTNATELTQFLAQNGVLIKDMSRSHPSLANCIRVSLGTDEELDRLEAGLRAFRRLQASTP